jgi:hypothetical protein
MKIHIDIRDGIEPQVAVEKVLCVIKNGRISKNNTLFCYLSVFPDNIAVTVNDNRKSDCFVVSKKINNSYKIEKSIPK